MNTKWTGVLTSFSRWLLCCVLMLLSNVAYSQQDSDACQLAVIKSSFQNYVQSVDRQTVVGIQDQLNKLGYGPVNNDGVLGTDTRLALQQLCQKESVTSSPEKLANVLVEMLSDNGSNKTPLLQDTAIINTTDALSQAETESSVLFNYVWSEPTQEDDDEPAPNEIVPDEIIEVLAGIEGIAYPNEIFFRDALDKLFEESDLDYMPYQKLILSQSRIEPDLTPNNIQINSDGCGCSGDYSKIIYGFYPYWQASGESQIVDFSLFDRIAFYSLAVNQDGYIQESRQWGDESNVAEFISTAHKHWVDVDVTIYATGWQTWSTKQLRRAVISTVDSVTHEFRPADTTGLLSLFSSDRPVQADGVTLVFDDYSGSTDNRANLIEYVTKVASQLSDNERDYQLNVMINIDVNELSKQTAFRDLDAILLEHNGKPALVNNVFVFLQQPTSASKKVLRRAIEDEFHGAERKVVMRKILPVISPRSAFSQFTDDLIYFQENFAGVGLWPLPLESDADVEMVKAKIIELYTSSSTNNRIGDLLDVYMPSLCQFACPNRWLFRIGFDVLAGLILLYAVLSIWLYRLRSLYQQYFLYFIGAGLLTLIVAMVSLVCDPYWQERANVVAALVFVVIAAMFVWRYVNKAMRPPLP